MTREKDLGLVDFNPKRDQVMDLWFQDCIEFGHGISIRIKIKNILYHSRSKFQEIAVLETEKIGRMLVIDGITMLTEWDEFAYHEMISHVPLIVHPKPSRVLIIGGGDGGTVREVIKHPEVELVHVCEIDEEVVRVCRKYMPSLASSFDDPRVQIFFEDGAQFVSKKSGAYDVIIVDSTDPLGPGQILFQEEFYKDLKNALSQEGIAVTQCESIYLHQHVIKGVFSFADNLFPKLSYYSTQVPTYPSGLIGFFFCSLKWDPLKDINESKVEYLKNLKYYTPEIHRASFTLPLFADNLFNKS
ncbi:MAG: polyamine aminopropyltransferase [Thermodesulfobacteriota bacterium]|nr:polyamine aminopropyltransferase [Thermodesulfobacteriota bacterium]